MTMRCGPWARRSRASAMNLKADGIAPWTSWKDAFETEVTIYAAVATACLAAFDAAFGTADGCAERRARAEVPARRSVQILRHLPGEQQRGHALVDDPSARGIHRNVLLLLQRMYRCNQQPIHK